MARSRPRCRQLRSVRSSKPDMAQYMPAWHGKVRHKNLSELQPSCQLKSDVRNAGGT